MSSSIPYFVQLLQALATPAIALLALVIGVFQWRTAQQKVVLDLFDRRLEKYTAIREVVGRIIRSGDPSQRDVTEFLRAMDGAEFLFGNDVTGYLEKIYDALCHMEELAIEKKTLSAGPQLTDNLARGRAAFEIVMSFYKKHFTDLLRPYMRMHQKAPPW
jgi:hypothetical protein